jgi:oligopeptide transport system substrate-binding protein
MKTVAKNILLTSLCLGGIGMSLAAVVPAGIQLHSKQEMVRNNGSEPDTLDPARAEGVPANNVIRDLFEGLTAVDGAGNTVPGVAESWKQVDAKTWVFKLRQNAKWSNGDPVTAEDFIYGMRRFVDPKTASEYAATFGIFFVNGKEIVEGKKPATDLGVKAIDKYTVELKTPFPVGFMPSLVSNTQLGPIHKASVEKHGKDWTKPGNMVNNGAYTMTAWDVNAKIVLTKSPTYWDAKNVQITKFTYLAVEDGNADVKLFESGENDMVYNLPPGTYDKYKTQYPKEIHNSPMLGLRYHSFLNTDTLLKDIKVRKALSMVIDRDILSQRVTADGQKPPIAFLSRVEGG